MIKKCHVTLKTSQKLTIEEFYLVLNSEELEYAFNLPNIVYICEHCPNGKSKIAQYPASLEQKHYYHILLNGTIYCFGFRPVLIRSYVE